MAMTKKEKEAMQAAIDRADRLLLAKHEPDGYTRALQWSYKQADRAKLEIVRVTRRIVRAA